MACNALKMWSFATESSSAPGAQIPGADLCMISRISCPDEDYLWQNHGVH